MPDRPGRAAARLPRRHRREQVHGFGVGALAGFLVGGRMGDVRPYATTITAAAATTVILLAICLLSGYALPVAALVALLGLVGLGANPVLIALAVRFAGRASVLGSALTVSAFNLDTAVGSWAAGLALDSTLGATGPPRSAPSSPR